MVKTFSPHSLSSVVLKLVTSETTASIFTILAGEEFETFDGIHQTRLAFY